LTRDPGLETTTSKDKLKDFLTYAKSWWTEAVSITRMAHPKRLPKFRRSTVGAGQAFQHRW